MKVPREVSQAVADLDERAEPMRRGILLFFIAMEKHKRFAEFLNKPVSAYSPEEIILMRQALAVLYTNFIKGGLLELKEQELAPIRERVLERRRKARSMRPPQNG